MKPIASYDVTTPYGKKGSWAAGFHTGDDYAAPAGTPVRATAPGRVIYAGRLFGWGQAYGKHVIIDSAGVRHMYAHLSSIALKKGVWVNRGVIVGRVGTTGRSTGNHLHYEERLAPWKYNNRVRNPIFSKSKWLTVSVANIVASNKTGKRMPGVATVQAALNREVGLDYSSGVGIWGPRTRAAWREYSGSKFAVPSRETLKRLGTRQGFLVQ